jgi:TolC family type I secretion outer membrane protein
MKKTVLAFVLCFLVTHPLAHVGADDGGGTISLGEAISIALEENQDVLVAQRRVGEAQSALVEARAAFFPSFDAVARYQRIDESPTFDVPIPFLNQTNEVSFLPTESYQAGFAAQQPLFTGGKLLNSYRVAGAGLRSREDDLEAVRNELIFRVKEAYYSILVAQKYADVAEQSVGLLDAHLRDVQRFLETGLVARVDLLRTEVQKADAEQQLNSAQNAVDLAKSAFNNLLDRSLDQPVQVEDVLQYVPRVISLEQGTQTALEQRPEIGALEAAVDMARRNVNIARSGYLPTLAAQGTYDWQKGTQLEILEEDWHWTVGISGSMSLWNWGTTRAQVAQAKSKLAQTELNLEKLHNGVALEVRQAFLKVGEAEKNVAVSEKAVASAQESYRTTKERYREGVGTNTDVLDAENALARAEANRYQALFDYNLGVARLDKAIGLGLRGLR